MKRLFQNRVSSMGVLVYSMGLVRVACSRNSFLGRPSACLLIRTKTSDNCHTALPRQPRYLLCVLAARCLQEQNHFTNRNLAGTQTRLGRSRPAGSRPPGFRHRRACGRRGRGSGIRVRLRHGHQHVAHGLAGEEGQEVVVRWLALMPGRLTERRNVGGDDDFGVLLFRHARVRSRCAPPIRVCCPRWASGRSAMESSDGVSLRSWGDRRR